MPDTRKTLDNQPVAATMDVPVLAANRIDSSTPVRAARTSASGRFDFPEVLAPMDESYLTDHNPWCGYCVDRKAHVIHEDGAQQALHLEREHGYDLLGCGMDPLAAPYALDHLHSDLHRSGERHAGGGDHV